MKTPPLDTPPADIIAQTFAATLDTMPGPLFAVLDGGHFDDLEDQLSDAGIPSRSLFLKGGDEAVRRDGPWLVALSDRRARDHISALALERPCAVFWSCASGEQALWRHLRTINEVMIHDARYPLNDGSPGRPVKYERVLLRHWDPNVLAPIVPLLDAAQLAQLFGPAQAIFINATTKGGVMQFQRPADLPRAPAGMLTIRPQQLAALEKGSQAAYCQRMSEILRQMAPQETAGMSQQQLNERVLRYEASGNRLGLTQERSLGIWGYFMLASGDRFENKPEIREFLRDGPGTPDENVETLLNQMVRLASSMEEVR
jgi:hypothetical protein